MKYWWDNGKYTEIDLSIYPKPFWAVSQLIRETGLVEDVCEHGIGHPNITWLTKHDEEGTKRFGVHGCCGCCSRKE